MARAYVEPRPGSTAAVDLQRSPHARWIQTSASIALGGAADHLSTWQVVVQARRLPTYAFATLLRAALEAALVTRWLVDSRVSPGERVGRGIAAQLADYAERAKSRQPLPRLGLDHPGQARAPRRVSKNWSRLATRRICRRSSCLVRHR